MTEAEFWNKAREVGTKATWAYLATSVGNQPKVRVVHPAIEDRRVWVATGRNSSKARQIAQNPRVELFYQIGTDMVQLTITGRARFIEDPIDSEDFGLMLIEPEKAELTSLAEMTQGKSPKLWRVAK